MSDTFMAGGLDPVEQEDIANKEEEMKRDSFDWGNVFGLLNTGIENSDKLAGAFSGKYRDDQIELERQRSQAGFFNFNQPNQTQNIGKYLIIGIVAVVVILVIVLLMKKKS